MYSCPACGTENVAGLAACRCGQDLSLLLSIEATADAWFNCGLEALEAGAPERALEWISACCAAKPTDAKAILLQAKLWARLGRWQAASAALDRAEKLDPSSSDLLAVRQALTRASAAPKRKRGKKHSG